MAQKSKPISKLLVANRGEIATRIFRSAVERGIKTVAIYSHEDRFSLHRYKADEAYEVGTTGAPVQAYLDIKEVLRVAELSGADAVHPGYGFLSERADLRSAVVNAGLIFVGPSDETLLIAGNKVRTREFAASVGVPIVPGGQLSGNKEQALETAEKIGYPVIIKAALGGGGRGMRIVRDAGNFASALDEALNEANAAFGASEVYLERYLERPKHIEVQLLGDGTGQVMHLFERDCSVQRRHQKLVEFAPAISLTTSQREQLFHYALNLARGLKLTSLATAEFLIADNGEIFFIEINPRIQVEHTVTEEITGIDLVRAQLDIASGRTLADLKLSQESLRLVGVAIQSRITTEDPENDFRPDYGRLVAYRSASGFGIRLDSGSAYSGGEVTPYYDSLLVKVTARGNSLEDAAGRLRRCLREFRIRGVKTNIQFLEQVLSHPEFLSGNCRTTFLKDFPDIFKLTRRRDRANRLLKFLADVTVNGHEQMPNLTRPTNLHIDHKIERNVLNKSPIPKGWRDELKALGKEKFLKRVRAEKRLLITDTTLRDAHQSLLATRMRTHDMLKIADRIAREANGLFSLEMWGGATFDVCLRFLREDPWDRLALLREAIPNILFQMLIRGANVVGYTSYPDNVIQEFVKESAKAGIDIFRIFDCFNNLDQMQVAIDAVKDSGAIAEVCLCYTGDILEQKSSSKFDLSYYLKLAEQLQKAGADMIAIKDMAGLLRPNSASLLISKLRETIDLPIHFHTHDTAGIQAASYLKAAEAGVDIVDCAFASMSGVTSQPSLEGMVAALANTERDTGLALEKLTEFSNYWDDVRPLYQPFESDLRTATGEVYLTEIPGGQYSNFRPQAQSLGVGDKWRELKHVYAEVNEMLGGIIKVTPSSKMVGDFAIFMLSNNLSIDDVKQKAELLNFPASVVEFFSGHLGEPYGGFPEQLRKAVLKGEIAFKGRPGDNLEPINFEQAEQEASVLLGKPAGRQHALSYVLYPQVFREYAAARNQFGDLIILPTLTFFYGLDKGEEVVVDLEPGKRLFITLIAVSEPNEKGERTAFFALNGQPRNISLRDRRVASTVEQHVKADSANVGHVAAPLAGSIVAIEVKVGDKLDKNDKLFTIEAMKMQTNVQAPVAGTVKSILLSQGTRVDVGDLIIEIK